MPPEPIVVMTTLSPRWAASTSSALRCVIMARLPILPPPPLWGRGGGKTLPHPHPTLPIKGEGKKRSLGQQHGLGAARRPRLSISGGEVGGGVPVVQKSVRHLPGAQDRFGE